MRAFRSGLLIAATSLLPMVALAGPDAFSTGPVIEGYGPSALVEGFTKIPDDMVLKVAFDTAKAGQEGGVNRTLESAARFLNMHGKAGVSPDRIDLAVIIHGPAVMDILKSDAYADRHDGADNVSAPLIKALRKHNVRIIVCGQTAAYRDVAPDDMVPGVEMDLSAMTAHARLQQQGYTLNPF